MWEGRLFFSPSSGPEEIPNKQAAFGSPALTKALFAGTVKALNDPWTCKELSTMSIIACSLLFDQSP
jgi:hypothetical protein